MSIAKYKKRSNPKAESCNGKKRKVLIVVPSNLYHCSNPVAGKLRTGMSMLPRKSSPPSKALAEFATLKIQNWELGTYVVIRKHHFCKVGSGHQKY